MNIAPKVSESIDNSLSLQKIVMKLKQIKKAGQRKNIFKSHHYFVKNVIFQRSRESSIHLPNA